MQAVSFSFGTQPNRCLFHVCQNTHKTIDPLLADRLIQFHRQKKIRRDRYDLLPALNRSSPLARMEASPRTVGDCGGMSK